MQKLLLSFLCLVLLGLNVNAQAGQRSKRVKHSRAAMQEFLQENFATAFPNGLEIGKGDLTLEFTSAEAISDFFPTNGANIVLEEAMIDPMGSDIESTIAGKALKIAITLGLDRAIEDFTASSIPLDKGYVVAVGPFEGKSVKEVLDMANALMAGEEIEATDNEMKRVLAKINNELLKDRKRILEVSEEYADMHEMEEESSEDRPRRGRK